MPGATQGCPEDAHRAKGHTCRRPQNRSSKSLQRPLFGCGKLCLLVLALGASLPFGCGCLSVWTFVLLFFPSLLWSVLLCCLLVRCVRLPVRVLSGVLPASFQGANPRTGRSRVFYGLRPQERQHDRHLLTRPCPPPCPLSHGHQVHTSTSEVSHTLCLCLLKAAAESPSRYTSLSLIALGPR